MVSFKLFAGTHVGLRDNNEDNFTVCPDLCKGEWIIPADHQRIIPLAECGCLLVVADGMGGQNAGEVASAIAIETVQGMFTSANLKADVVANPDKIKDFLKKVVIEADQHVKKHSIVNPQTVGMGSTIVISWIIGEDMYVAWLGDSRAYCFVPDKGIGRLTKDHSYVQRLVDAGTLTEEQAMNHPDSNIITRSLGDVSQKAKPDVMHYSIEKGMVVLLCSDGLCGICTDAIIGGIIEDKYTDLRACKEELTEAALAAGGSDNITIALLEIVDMDGSSGKQSHSVVNENKAKDWFNMLKKSSWMWLLIALFVLLCIIITVCLTHESVDTPAKDTDSIQSFLEKSEVDKTKESPRLKENESKVEDTDSEKKKTKSIQLEEGVVKNMLEKEAAKQNDTSSVSGTADTDGTASVSVTPTPAKGEDNTYEPTIAISEKDTLNNN